MIKSYIMIMAMLITYIMVKLIPIKNKNQLFLLMSFGEIFIILILRTPISDMVTYVQSFKNLSLLSFSELMRLDWEKGYLILNKVIAIISNNERVFIIITSFIGLIGPYIFIKKYSNNYLLSLVIYIGLNFLTIQYYLIRQSIALTFVILSIEAINNRKLFKFIIYICIATLFHKSAIIFLIIYILSVMKIKKIYTYGIFVITFIFREQISRFFVGFSDYSVYFSDNSATLSGMKMLVLLIMCDIIMGILKHYEKKSKIISEDKCEIILNRMYVTAIFFQILALNTSMMARIVMYFSIALVILLPNNIMKVKNIYLKLTCYFIVFIAIFQYSIILPNNFQYILFFGS